MDKQRLIDLRTKADAMMGELPGLSVALYFANQGVGVMVRYNKDTALHSTSAVIPYEEFEVGTATPEELLAPLVGAVRQAAASAAAFLPPPGGA